MSDTKLMTGRDLGKAICAHFGLNINQVQSDYRIKTELDGLASINLTISLTADDLAGIARAAGADDGEQGPELVNFSTPSRVYTADETRDILRRYAAGAKAAKQALTIKVDADEVKELLAKISEEFARQRAAIEEAFIEISDVAKYVSQALSKWDADGMPLRK